MRSISHSLPPLTHLKEHNANVQHHLPVVIEAPGRSGGFISLREEATTQLEHLVKTVGLTTDDHVYLKTNIDAAKFMHRSSVCVYSLEIITKKGSQIGAVGACLGGDSYADMSETAKPFFINLKELAKIPFIQTSAGVFHVDVRQGGDMSNTSDLFGIVKPTGKHPCLFCVLPKSLFALVFSRADLLQACNTASVIASSNASAPVIASSATSVASANLTTSTCSSSSSTESTSASVSLARTKGKLLEECCKSVRNHGVKNIPLSPLPLDLNLILLRYVLICILHLRMRITGNHSESMKSK